MKYNYNVIMQSTIISVFIYIYNVTVTNYISVIM